MRKEIVELEEECEALQASGRKKSKHIQGLEEQYAAVEETVKQLRQESEKLCDEEVHGKEGERVVYSILILFSFFSLYISPSC